MDKPEDVVDNIVRGFEKGIRNMDLDGRLERLMKENIADNFRDEGGPRAGGGMVQWPRDRAAVTEREREQGSKRGTYLSTINPDSDPYLVASGQMKVDYTINAHFRTRRKTKNTAAWELRGGTSESREKMRKHQTGGPHTAVFDHLRGSSGRPLVIGGFPFPRREVLFWNTFKAKGLRNMVRENVNSWIRNEMARGTGKVT